LADPKLAGVLDAVYPSQLLVGNTIGFADPVEGLARRDRMIDSSKLRLGNRRLRRTAPDKKENQNNQRSGTTIAVYQIAGREYLRGQAPRLHVEVVIVYGV